MRYILIPIWYKDQLIGRDIYEEGKYRTHGVVAKLTDNKAIVELYRNGQVERYLVSHSFIDPFTEEEFYVVYPKPYEVQQLKEASKNVD